MPYWLFSHRKITGSFQTAAILMLSWKAPSLEAPSPKKQMQTWSVSRRWMESPAPTERGRPPETTPLAPRLPTFRSAMCMDPPRPRQTPVSFASSSAIIVLMSCPLAMACPCPRWVEVIISSGRSAAIAPTATASWPAHRCMVPCTLPRAYCWKAASSKIRVRCIFKSMSLSISGARSNCSSRASSSVVASGVTATSPCAG